MRSPREVLLAWVEAFNERDAVAAADLYDEDEGWKPTHIELADAADLLLIAPATANCIAKLAHGLANDSLSCIALALNPNARVLIAPAMNGKMWLHPATQRNVAQLKADGCEFIGLDCVRNGSNGWFQIFVAPSVESL